MHRSQLNTSRGPWKSKRTRMGTRTISALPGRTRKQGKGTGKKWDGTSNSRGIRREERSPHLGKLLTEGESPAGTEGKPHFLWEKNTARVRDSRTE